jgi:aryl-alcohol dehydrogenase-like predicted oxidoreductase
MQYRPLGKTGLQVSAISLGTWAMGGDAWGPVTDAESATALARAYELGVNFFDTADVYGRGHSEEVLGAWLKTVPRDKVYIATKAGLWPEHFTRYRRARRKITRAARKAGLPRRLALPHRYLRPRDIIDYCDRSLRRLQTDYIDVYQDHLWWDEHVEAFAEAFHRLRDAGKVRFFGVSTNDVAYMRRFAQVAGGMDTLQIDYSILNRQPEREALPFCQERQIGVIARGSLAMGKLTGKFTAETRFAQGDNRQEWTASAGRADFLRDLHRVAQLAPLATGGTLAQAALAFVLCHPAVSTTIPGARNPRQVEENVAAASRRLTPEDLALIDRVSMAPAA